MREPADAAARASELVDDLRRSLPTGKPLVLIDLACGTGAMMRWLAPHLPGPQHWVNYDIDADLLAAVMADPAAVAADGSPVTMEVRRRDITRLRSADLTGADLIACSAVLDLLCAAELRRIVVACAAAQCPVLFTLSVTGTVRLEPSHPLDEVVAAAFNAHQRRTTRGRTLLGPDAVDAATRMFTDLGREAVTRPSPWRLGPTGRELVNEWLVGWLSAAGEQDPRLAVGLDSYARQRVEAAEAGRLRVFVQHRDLLVRPAPGGKGDLGGESR